MSNATVGADSPTLPEATSNDGRPATIDEAAARHFEPSSADELEACKPPTNEEWMQCLVVVRLAYGMIGKTKAEMKTVVQALNDSNSLDDFYAFAETSDTLRCFAEVVESAEARFLVAASSVAQDEKKEEAAR
jgi:hypothetical protein